MSDLFSKIAFVVPKIGGWCSVDKAQALAATVLTLRHEVTLEIGVLEGRSLIPMAMAHQQIGRGKVIGVDAWDAAASREGQVNQADAKFWGELDHKPLYERFIQNLEKAKVREVVEVHWMRSQDFPAPDDIGVLHLDGNHGEQAYHDVCKFGTHVVKGGFCFLDDLNWSGGGVLRAEAALIGMSYKKLYHMDTGAMYQRL